jgi:hypothetical protein
LVPLPRGPGASPAYRGGADPFALRLSISVSRPAGASAWLSLRILSYAIWTSLLKVGLARTPMTILENNCMQSTASSAGYSTGGTLISAFAAYIIINHRSMSVSLMLAWVFFMTGDNTIRRPLQ